jgi:hypothetical protein
MSNYVYVTRKSDPLSDTGPQISANEWVEVVANDRDLAIADPPDRSPGYTEAIYAVWNEYPGGYPAWFGLAYGNIEVKGLDESILVKLRGFAQKLNARIVSEEGEEFS